MTVTNTGNEAWSFSGNDQKLKDGMGREYSANWIVARENFNDGDEINPGIQVSVGVVFDVPPSMQPTQIVLHDSMFSGGVSVDLT
jgi:hypothetical protein